METRGDHYVADFARLENRLTADGRSWTRTIREAAISRFAELGFPTTRDEEWKYTNVAPLAKIPFKSPPVEGNGIGTASLASVDLGEPGGTRLVFVNGHYGERLSSLQALPGGVKAGSLAAALGHDSDRVEPYITRYARYQEHAFVALNTAFMADGAFLYIPKGAVIREPIYVCFISGASGEASVTYPRNLIVMEADSQATIIESYVSLEDGVYFTNAVTELVLGENAVVDHYKVERESARAFHIATLQVHQDRSSRFTSHSIALGGSLVRNEINTVLRDEGGECALNGLYLAADQQHVDNHTRIEHVGAHCISRELYKGVLSGRARGVFNGKIVVHKNARKTDAMQVNKNLLLSEDALVDTKPQLEINNNDVKCSHGSTIGRLDEGAIFYVRSRGIGLEAARNLLTYAFSTELISRVRVDSLRAQLEKTWLTSLQKISETRGTA